MGTCRKQRARSQPRTGGLCRSWGTQPLRWAAGRGQHPDGHPATEPLQPLSQRMSCGTGAKREGLLPGMRGGGRGPGPQGSTGLPQRHGSCPARWLPCRSGDAARRGPGGNAWDRVGSQAGLPRRWRGPVRSGGLAPHAAHWAGGRGGPPSTLALARDLPDRNGREGHGGADGSPVPLGLSCLFLLLLLTVRRDAEPAPHAAAPSDGHTGGQPSRGQQGAKLPGHGAGGLRGPRWGWLELSPLHGDQPPGQPASAQLRPPAAPAGTLGMSRWLGLRAQVQHLHLGPDPAFRPAAGAQPGHPQDSARPLSLHPCAVWGPPWLDPYQVGAGGRRRWWPVAAGPRRASPLRVTMGRAWPTPSDPWLPRGLGWAEWSWPRQRGPGAGRFSVRGTGGDIHLVWQQLRAGQRWHGQDSGDLAGTQGLRRGSDGLGCRQRVLASAPARGLRTRDLPGRGQRGTWGGCRGARWGWLGVHGTAPQPSALPEWGTIPAATDPAHLGTDPPAPWGS